MLKKIKDFMAKNDKEPTLEELDDQIKNSTENTDQDSDNEEVKKKSKKKSPSKTTKLTKEIEELKMQIDESKDKHLRLLAEFENFKKRTIREKLDIINSAAQDTMTSLLPVLDDFDRAKKEAENDGSEEQFSEGVNLVYQKLYAVLTQKGLKPMETNNNEFDPELHEAITDIPAPTPEMKGKVIDTIDKGSVSYTHLTLPTTPYV